MRAPFSFVRVALLALGVLGLFAAAPESASALQCKRRVIDTGESQAYVRALCGEPTSVTSRAVTRTVFGYVRGAGAGAGSSTTVTVQVDVWVYDFGPNRFMVELTFEDGILVNERTLHYGTTAGRPPS